VLILLDTHAVSEEIITVIEVNKSIYLGFSYEHLLISKCKLVMI